MKKHIIICVLMIVVLLFNSSAVYSEKQTIVIYDGEEIKLSTPIIIEEGVMLVPVRSIFESLGAKVDWDALTESITITKDNINIILKINKQISKIGEKYCMLDMPVKLLNSNALIPLNFVNEVFSVDVKVDEEKNAVYIYDTSFGFPLISKSHILIEPNSGLIILEHNSHKQLSTGNVTKIMNLILIFEAIENKKISVNDVVKVSEQASRMEGSQLFLETDEEILVEDLIKSIIMIGANDSAMALAEYISGDKEIFIEQMNKKAEELGLRNTNFVNITGVDEYNHYTSAYDVAIMAQELVNKYKNVLEYSSLKEDKILRKLKKNEIIFPLNNGNKLLKEYKYTSGLIKGYTYKANHCLVGTAKKDRVQLIAVTLGSLDNDSIIQETTSILKYGFEKFNIIK